MSVIRQETWLSRLDLERLAARANAAAEKPADIATSGTFGIPISRWAGDERPWLRADPAHRPSIRRERASVPRA
jgi:hypothetical protein